VERQRRGSGSEEIPDDEPMYTLYSLGGAPCIMAKLDANFYLQYRTLRHGTQEVRVELPKEPKIEGRPYQRQSTLDCPINYVTI
jgi:hypothetical protein